MATGAVGSTGSTSGSSSSSSSNNTDKTSALDKLDLDQFLKLMITELQNQDPLNPMQNNEILQQIGEIRQVGATDKLSTTLDSVLLGQGLANASSLIGKNVSGLTDAGKTVSGVVDKVTVTDGKPALHIGTDEISLTNVRDILPAAA